MALEYEIGFLGGGQLARMSIQAAQRMGLRCLSLDAQSNSPASQIAPSIQAKLNDVEALSEVVSSCAFVTLENEFVSAQAIRAALQAVGRDESMLTPGLHSLEVVQDKLSQRQAFQSAGVPSPRATAIEDDGANAVATIGFPMVLKARFGGYDGRGTKVARNKVDFEDLKVSWSGGGWLAEEFVEFKREVAVMVMRWLEPTFDPLNPPEPGTQVRLLGGTFPTVETVQANYVCDLVLPTEVDASDVAMQAVAAVGGLGLFGVELFETESGEFIVNEIAPRPHNSGHYTLDWGGPSQFDQHVRLTLRMRPVPLMGMHTAMINLFGIPDAGDPLLGMAAAIAQDPGARIHWYGKADAVPGRKMGHINVVGNDLEKRAMAAREAFYAGWRRTAEEP